jgi:hypothetical protein
VTSYAEYREALPTLRASGGDIGKGSEALIVYPKVTGALCANSHPGSYTGQDAFNNMLPVIRREDDDLLDISGDQHIHSGGGVKQFDGKGLQGCTGFSAGREREKIRAA